MERDCLTDDAGPAAPRKGVPQDRHVHALLPSGAAALDRLLPGILDDLAAEGAVQVDLGADMRWFHHGGYKRRFRAGLPGSCQTRPLLERHVRRRCLAPANLRVRERWEAVGLAAGPDPGVIVGAELRPVGGGAIETVAADLVVDATGRGSRAGDWLAALGHERPPETAVRADVAYTTRLYRRPDGRGGDGARVILVQPRAPAERRGGAALAVEGGLWQVTLVGRVGEAAPAEEAGFLEYARSLPVPDFFDLVRAAEPASGFAVHRFPASLRRRYEAVPHPPAGFLAVGDAACSFNPVYGQGVTAAALEAEALAATMAALEAGRRGPGALPRAFFRAAARVIDDPWRLAVGEDLRFPGVAGPRPPGSRLLDRYAELLQEATTADAEVYRTFLEVVNLIRPPTALFRPGTAWRVLRHRLTAAARAA